MLALLAIALLAQTPQHRLFLQPNLPRQGGGLAPPAFAFATGSGVGMGSACACTAVTGTKGEAITFTRASSGTCLKASTTTGIANGDMATCSTNQPRVGTGGSGPLKLLSEEARTNQMLRSQEIDNAAWTSAVSGVAAMTVTADAAVAPDGTTTADRLQIPAAGSTATNYSQRYQLITDSVTQSCSLFVKGNGTSGTFNARLGDAGGGIVMQCAYNPSTWSWCSVTRLMSTSAAFALGSFNTTDYGGQGANGAAFDGYVVGVQCEAAPNATSYIATAGVAVTRALDVGYFAANSYPNGSMAADMMVEGTPGSSIEIAAVALSVGASYDRLPIYRTAITGATLYGTSGTATVSAAAPVPYVVSRIAADWTGTAANVYYGGSAGSGTLNVPGTHTRLYVGLYNGTTGSTNGWVGNVCLDPNPLRCR